MLNIPKIELGPYLDMAWRRKWWVVLPLILSLIAGAAYLYQSPKVYRSSTLILVEAQRVPSKFVPDTVSENLQNRLQTISQQVHSRTNLEDIIERFELLPSQKEQEPSLAGKIKRKLLSKIGLMEASAQKQEEKEPSMQQLVRNVRNKINVNLRARNQAFEISFEWRDPQVAAQVANALASQFIDRNLKVREEMAMGTTNFLESQVQRLREELQKREKALEDFKRRNMGRLPSQLDSNMNMLSQLKEELGRIEDREEEVRRQLILNSQQSASSDALDAEHFLQQDEDAQEIEELQERLQQLRTRYKDQHPDIQVLQRRINQLQEKQAEMSLEDFQPLPKSRQSSPEQEMIQVQKQELQMRLDNFEEQKKELRQEISKYEQRIEETSEVELQLKNLERDYNAVNDRYQNMLRKKLDAEMGEQMERRQQGEQFRVVDPAITPDQPFKPDRKKVLAMALFLGLGLGGGLGYLRESLDPTFYTPQELEQQLNTKVVVSLPMVHDEKKGK
ncbi:MAG: GumC family protein [Desulfohalobiaceae bacterium]